jgi:hypothetical protein
MQTTGGSSRPQNKFFVEAVTMRYHHATITRRWLKKALTVFMVLSGLAVVGLPDSHAQMRYSGGFRPTHQRPPQLPLTQASIPPTAAPSTPHSYFPDNDGAYPFYYAGSEPRRPLPPPGGVWLYSVLATDLPWNQEDFEDYNESLSTPRDSSVQQAKKYF